MIPTYEQNRLVRRRLDKKFEDPPPVPPIPNVATYHPGAYNSKRIVAKQTLNMAGMIYSALLCLGS